MKVKGIHLGNFNSLVVYPETKKKIRDGFEIYFDSQSQLIKNVNIVLQYIQLKFYIGNNFKQMNVFGIS